MVIIKNQYNHNPKFINMRKGVRSTVISSRNVSGLQVLSFLTELNIRGDMNQLGMNRFTKLLYYMRAQ